MKTNQWKITYTEARFGNYGMEHDKAILLLESMGFEWITPKFDECGTLINGTGEWKKLDIIGDL